MITITTMVPMPINMGFLSDAPASRDGAAFYLAGLARSAMAVCPGPCWGCGPGAHIDYFLKTSLIFSPACLRSPLA